MNLKRTVEKMNANAGYKGLLNNGGQKNMEKN